MSGGFKRIIVLPHIQIHNANALSSPFTIGFPAMTAWLGATHALQRKINQDGFDVEFTATGVVSHAINLQTYRGQNDFVASIIGTGNPLDKTGSRSAFIEEARCHLEVTLVIEYQGLDAQQEDSFKEKIIHLLNTSMKIAGGDVRQFEDPQLFVIENNNVEDSQFKRLVRKLMPGYVLIERRELMIEAMEQGQDGIDAIIDYIAIHHSCSENDTGEVLWQSKRKTRDDKPAGWVVPIATGFQAISELGVAKNQRDHDALHCFAESIITLGEFKMPYRLLSIEDMLWRYHYDEENQSYQCVQSSTESSIQSTITLEDEFS